MKCIELRKDKQKVIDWTPFCRWLN